MKIFSDYEIDSAYPLLAFRPFAFAFCFVFLRDLSGFGCGSYSLVSGLGRCAPFLNSCLSACFVAQMVS